MMEFHLQIHDEEAFNQLKTDGNFENDVDVFMHAVGLLRWVIEQSMVGKDIVAMSGIDRGQWTKLTGPYLNHATPTK